MKQDTNFEPAEPLEPLDGGVDNHLEDKTMNPITNFEKWINAIATGMPPDISPVTRFEHFLNKIRVAIARKSDIGSGLPDVTAKDNDKVLTVVDGVWDKAVPSGGGGGALIVHVNRTPNGPTLDKTWKEIFDALETNMVVISQGNSTDRVSQLYVYLASDLYNVVTGTRECRVTAGGFGDTTAFSFVTDSVNGYPVGVEE